MNRRTALTLATLALAACRPPDPMVAGVVVRPDFDLQGHRGARGLRPENTLPAVEIALDAGVATIELDLHLTDDDVLVVWHDPALLASKCVGPGVSDDLQTAPRLRALRYQDLAEFECRLNPDADRFPDQEPDSTVLLGDDYRIVRIEVLLDFIDLYAASETKTRAQRANAANVRLNLELKRVEDEAWWIDDDFDGTHPATFEKEVVKVVRDRGLEDRVTLQSFDHRSLRAIHSIAPDLQLAALTEPALLPNLAELAADGIRIWSPHHQVLTTERVNEAHQHGLRVVPWTVNDPARMRELIEMGVDGIITDLGGDVTFSRLGRR